MVGFDHLGTTYNPIVQEEVFSYRSQLVRMQATSRLVSKVNITSPRPPRLLSLIVFAAPRGRGSPVFAAQWPYVRATALHPRNPQHQQQPLILLSVLLPLP